MNIDISFIIVNYDVFEDVVNCINSIDNTVEGLSYEIFVADNNSKDRSIERMESMFKNVHLIQLKSNLGFGFASNRAATLARGDYLLFVNPDIIFLKNTIKKLYDFITNNPSTGSAGPLIKRTDGSIQYYYTFFPSVYSRLMQEFGFYETAKKMKKRKFDFLNENVEKKMPFKVDWVLGACMITRRNLFEQLEGFDESFFLYEEEVDLLFRMNNRGMNTYIVPSSEVIHNHNTSTSKLGFAFIRYHGFRSIIIYSNKHDLGFKRFISKFILTFGITYRYLRGIISKKYRLGSLRSHSILFGDLFMLNMTGSAERAKSHRHFEITRLALLEKEE